MYLITLLLIPIFSFVGSSKLNTIPSHKGSIQLLKKAIIIDAADGFYNTILSTKSGNKYIIYDDGNKKVNIFNEKSELLKSFGKEGSGPGELFQIKQIYSNEEYIYLRSTRKILIFKHDGSLVNEVSEHVSFGGDLILYEKKLSLLYTETKAKKIYRIDYSLDGKTLKTYLRSKIEVVADPIKRWLISPKDIQNYESGFVRFYPGEYKLEFLDKTTSTKKIITKDYERIHETEYPDWLKASIEKDGNNKARIEKRAKFIQLRNQLSGGFYSDIISILGTYKGLLFVQTSSENMQDMNIDVISNSNELYDQISLKGDKIISAYIIENELLVNYKNENEGPYLKSFEIKI